MAVERYYEDARVGDECVTPSVTVTAEMINAYADLSGDHTPIHVDEEYAKKSDFGTRVGHGLLGLSLADGLKTQAEYRSFQENRSGGLGTSLRRSRLVTPCTSNSESAACVRRASRAGASSYCRPSSSISAVKSCSAASTR